MEVLVLKTAAQILSYQEALTKLCHRSSEKNVFYSPWMLSAALQYLRDSDDVRVLLMMQPEEAPTSESNYSRTRIIGLVPLLKKNFYHGIPFPCFSLWQHIHCFLCTPLIEAGYEEACINELFDWIDRESPNALMIELGRYGGGGPFDHALYNVARHKRRVVVQTLLENRPILRPGLGFDAYIRVQMSTKHYKNLTKRLGTLSGMGKVNFEHRSNFDQQTLHRWTEEFLGLESRGWKGRRDDAMAQDSKERQYFHTIMEEANKAQALSLWKLSLDGETIAMRINFHQDNSIFSFKIAFDEKYARLSPGMLLEIEFMKELLESPDHDWLVDSCTMGPSTFLSRLWHDVRPIVSANISTSSTLSVPAVKGLAAMRNLFRSFRHPEIPSPEPEGDRAPAANA